MNKNEEFELRLNMFQHISKYLDSEIPDWKDEYKNYTWEEMLVDVIQITQNKESRKDTH